MSQTNVQTFSGDVEITGGLSVTGTVISTVGTDKVQLTTTSASETDYIPVSKGATGAQALYTDSNLTYNPSTNQIAANLSGNVTGNVSGNLTGNVSGNIAGSADTVAFTARNATNDTDYIAFVDTSTAGDKALFTDSNLTYNSSTNTIGANLSGNVTGDLTGNVTGNVSGNIAGSADTVAFTVRNSNTTDYIAFVDTNTAGDKALYVDSNLTYNSSTNTIGANLSGNVTGNVTGSLTGNVTGNVSGSAASATNASSAASADLVAFTARNATANTDYIAFVDTNTAGDKALFTDSNLTYNSSTNQIAANLSGNVTGSLTGNVTGNVSGSAASATNASSAASADLVAFTARNATANTDYIAFVDTNTAGDKALFTDSNLTYNSSTNQIAANLSGNVTGNLTGNVTGNVSGTAGSADSATNASAVAFTVRNSNTTDYIAFVDTNVADNKALYVDSNLTYNSSTNQIGANLSGNVSGTNVSATTLHYPTQTIQPVLNGGGTVTYNASSYIKWSERVIAIPIESNEMGASGYIDIETPVSGTITYFSGSSGSTTATCTAAGVPMGAWQALYYVVTPGQASGTDQTRFRLVNYQNSSWNPDSNWILICVRNGDDQQLKWLPGQTILAPGQSYDSATRGTYGAVFADSATSATKLTTARTIGGVSFNGTANINLPGVNAAGTQNTTGSAAKLTTARTIGGVSFDGSANIDLPGVNAAGSQNTTGSAATLTTSRTIGGVSFDGSANIDLPGVNTDGTQNTTGSAATLTTSRTINGVDFNGSGDIIVEPYISNDDTGDTNCPIVFTQNTTAGYKRLYEDSALYFDNTNNRLYSTQMSLGTYVYHTSDTNTYFGFPGNDTYIIGTAGVERFRVDSGGNVGIGTVAPGAILDVAGQYGDVTNAMVHFRTNRDANNNGDGNVLKLETGGNRSDAEIFECISPAGSRFVVKADGNVGIGTNDPTYKLDVNGTVNTGALTATSATVPNDGDFVMGGKPLTSASGLHWDRVNSRLGVGTNAPAYTLDVTGTARVSDDLTAESTSDNITILAKAPDTKVATLAAHGTAQGTGRLFVGQDSFLHGGGLEYNGDNSPASTGAGQDYLALYRVETGAYNWTARNSYNSNNWEFRGTVTAPTFSGNVSGNVTGSAANISSSNATMPAYIKHASDTNTYFGFPANDTYVVGTSGAERMRVDSDGNVGIGTDNPAYKLDVNGTINATALYVGGSEFTGGGFDPDVTEIAIGTNAGQTTQGSYAVAVGREAGQSNQKPSATALGDRAGSNNQGSQAVAVGILAGQTNQSGQATAVGPFAGRSNQSGYTTAVGYFAGYTGQGNSATALGQKAAQYNQGADSVAVGNAAGETSQGSKAIALGFVAARYNQPANTFCVSTYSVRDANGSEYLHYNNITAEISKGNTYSDDRLKYNEKIITGAIKSLFKLRPEEYDKKPSLKPSHTGQYWTRESGLIAQEIYYSAPEFRHLVQVPQTAGDVDNYTPPPSDDPNQDPDYSVWGEESPAVKYEQFVPYLIKAVQEIVTELPRSKTTVSNVWGQNIAGLVVSANANAHKTNATPRVTLSNVYADKTWYGVVSNKKTDTNDYDTLVDTKGDTQIWVTDVGGLLESGDLVTTSNVAPGFTQKQDSGALMNYTVAKVTQDCDFTEPAQRAIRVPKQELSNVTYYLRITEQDINIDAYEKLYETQRKIKTTPVYVKENERGEEQFFHGEIQVSEEKYKTLPEDERSKKRVVELETDKYDELSDEEKAEYTLGTRERWFVVTTTKSKNPIPEHTEEVVVEELVDVLDDNGQIVWEETGETEPVYTLVDHGSYKAALVSAKLV